MLQVFAIEAAFYHTIYGELLMDLMDLIEMAIAICWICSRNGEYATFICHGKHGRDDKCLAFVRMTLAPDKPSNHHMGKNMCIVLSNTHNNNIYTYYTHYIYMCISIYICIYVYILHR